MMKDKLSAHSLWWPIARRLTGGYSLLRRKTLKRRWRRRSRFGDEGRR
jgi:hypothetical protein